MYLPSVSLQINDVLSRGTDNCPSWWIFDNFVHHDALLEKFYDKLRRLLFLLRTYTARLFHCGFIFVFIFVSQKSADTISFFILNSSSRSSTTHNLIYEWVFFNLTNVTIHGNKACFKTSTSKFRYERTWILTSTSWNMPFSRGSSQICFFLLILLCNYHIGWLHYKIFMRMQCNMLHCMRTKKSHSVALAYRERETWNWTQMHRSKVFLVFLPMLPIFLFPVNASNFQPFRFNVVSTLFWRQRMSLNVY